MMVNDYEVLAKIDRYCKQCANSKITNAGYIPPWAISQPFGGSKEKTEEWLLEKVADGILEKIPGRGVPFVIRPTNEGSRILEEHMDKLGDAGYIYFR